MLVAFGREPRAARAADRVERIVVDLAARHHRDLLVEQRHERAEQARLRLAAQAEQDEVVLRQQRVDQLRHDGVVVADDAGKERLAGAQLAIRFSRTSSCTLRRGTLPSAMARRRSPTVEIPVGLDMVGFYLPSLALVSRASYGTLSPQRVLPDGAEADRMLNAECTSSMLN